MIFDLTHKILAALVGFIVICGAVLSVYYVREREARVRAETTEQVNKKAQDEIHAQMDQLAKQNQDFQVQQEQKLAQLTQTFSKAQSPQDIAVLAAALMKLQQPIKFETPPATKENPNPQPVAVIPAIDAPQVKDYLFKCEKCSNDLQTSQGNLLTEQNQHSLTKKDLQLMTDDRDKWKNDAKGGPWIKRAAKVLKTAACAGLGAAAGGQKNPSGAAIGAAAGAVACNLF